MNICVMGYKGFVGSAVSKHLLEDSRNTIVGIGSQSPDSLSFFDVVINCAGVSSKYFTSKFYDKAYSIERIVLERIKRMNFERLIHISSVDVKSSCPYGCLKKFIENKYREFIQPSSRLIVLRLGGLVGRGLKKNIIFDLLNDKNIYVTSNSVFNYISTREIAKIISFIITKGSLDGTINVAAKDNITVEEICHILGKNPIRFGLRKEDYDIKIDMLKTFFKPKSSSYYIGKEIK